MDLEKIANEIRGGRRVVALTGAGISSAAGIPTFRGKNGLWERIDPEKFSLGFFKEKPEEWWSIAKNLFSPFIVARPTRAHYALSELERLGHLEAVITQNIDGLHQLAGSRNVIELHGNVMKLKCILCGMEYNLNDYIDDLNDDRLPICKRCGRVLKTGAVLFGEEIPKREYLLSIYYASVSDVMLVIGTSLEVEPAATLPSYALRNGARIIYINRDVSGVKDKGFIIVEGDSEIILPEIVKNIRGD
ncbi:MAG: SIR2 family NAD-dependent protein deacylase [Thermoplasmata archaeon]|jgi:NAD-dependent deacetylase|nr:NAD-dependent protein deacylase [Thermoplasmatales archaeon]PMP75235.1 MAG: NAD-dependent protein deacylase [Aciduliprofundum sp.]